MRKIYSGAVCGEPGSYGIVFLDFPGCISAGETFEEVLAMGAEALEGHIASMIDGGDPIPAPSVHALTDVEQWLADPEEADDQVSESWLGLYPIEVEVPAPSDTVTVRLKADLVKRISDLAEQRVIALSSRDFIESAVEHELDRQRKTA